MSPDLEPYLDEGEPETWPWQLKFFFVVTLCLLVEMVAVLLVTVGWL